MLTLDWTAEINDQKWASYSSGITTGKMLRATVHSCSSPIASSERVGRMAGCWPQQNL